MPDEIHITTEEYLAELKRLAANAAPPPEWGAVFTLKDIGAALGRSFTGGQLRGSLRRLCLAGKIRGKKLHDGWRFCAADVVAAKREGLL